MIFVWRNVHRSPNRQQGLNGIYMLCSAPSFSTRVDVDLKRSKENGHHNVPRVFRCGLSVES
jgi:hypothetical protein